MMRVTYEYALTDAQIQDALKALGVARGTKRITHDCATLALLAIEQLSSRLATAERLLGDVSPGTPLARLRGVFVFAEREFGRSPASSRDALHDIEDGVANLRASLATAESERDIRLSQINSVAKLLDVETFTEVIRAIGDLLGRLTRAERGRDVAIANRDQLGKSWHEIAQAIGGIPLHECPKDIDPCPECQKTLADLVTEAIRERDKQLTNAREGLDHIVRKYDDGRLTRSDLAQLRTVLG